jgi:hypothetical protein
MGGMYCESSGKRWQDAISSTRQSSEFLVFKVVSDWLCQVKVCRTSASLAFIIMERGAFALQIRASDSFR